MRLSLTFIFFLFFSFDLLARETITLGVTPMVLKSSQGQLSEKVFRIIFNKLNFDLVIKRFPPVRLAERMKSGIIDGELIRMSTYGDSRPYLTKVEESHFKFTLAAYSSNKEIVISGWDSIKNKHTAYRKGVKVVENKLFTISDKSYLHSFSDIPRAMKMLDLKRIELYVGIEYLVDEMLKESNTKSSKGVHKIVRLSKNSAHLFLGKKYSYLAEKVSHELILMKKSGEYKKIRLSIRK